MTTRKGNNRTGEANAMGPGVGRMDDEIVIERREVIATISADPYGTRSMLQVAFETASGYVTENARSGESIRVEFGFGDHRFTIGADPRD